MSTYPSDRPDPLKTTVNLYPKSGLAHVSLTLYKHQVTDCKRCPKRRCAEKIKHAPFDPETGALTCGRHRMPASKVSNFIWGPTTAEPDHHEVADDEQLNRDLVGFPLEASWTTVDFFGAKGILFAWSDAAWAIEPNKPDAWPIRDGRLLIVPSTNWEVCPRAGRSERFGVVEKLDVEVNVNGIIAIYTLTPQIGDESDPSPRGHMLVGNGGIPAIDITCRKDLLGTMKGHRE
jgi:hypothetical protein